MYPPNEPAESQSGAERRLFHLFRERLGPDYYVVHSTSWHAVDEQGRVADGEADFIVIHPDHGVLVLEVKGGGITRNGVTRRWHTINGQGKRAQIKDPFKQAMQSKHVLIRTVKAAPATKPYASSYKFSHGVWLPDVKWPRTGEGTLQGLDELALDAHHLRDPEKALLDLYAHFAGTNPPGRLSEEAIDALVELLSPTITVKSSLAAQIAGDETRIRELTEAQYDRLRSMWSVSHQAAVQGPAGTGKTVLAMEMAWRLAAEGHDVLLLCANEKLADWLSYKVEQDSRPNKSRFDLHSVISLVTAIAQRGGMRESQIARLQIESAANQKTLCSILSENIRVLEKRGDPMPYNAIIVDEAQDIEQSLWTPIQKLLRHRTDDFFYVFADEAQRVDLPGKWTFRPAGARSVLPLTENCRNTAAIYELMAHFNPVLANYRFSGPTGRPIQYIDPDKAPEGSDAEERILLRILDELMGPEGELRPEDILVISCRSLAKSRFRLADGQKLGEHRLRWLKRGEKDGCVPLSTIRSAKGLEYKVVILVELDGLEDEQRKRDGLLYVAVSRAMYHLVVFSSEFDFVGKTPSLWDNLVSATVGSRQQS